MEKIKYTAKRIVENMLGGYDEGHEKNLMSKKYKEHHDENCY